MPLTPTPSVQTIENLAVVFLGRLDYQDELRSALRIPLREQSKHSNQSLLLLSYAKWGVAFVERLYGDWAFALWDGDRQQLLLARDQCGRAELFYYLDSENGRLYFSSSLKPILQLPGGPPPLNLAHIAQHAPGATRNASTPYQGVERLTHGHLLIAQDLQHKIHRYWSLNDIPAVHLPSSADYVEAFREHYTHAVRNTLADAGSVGAFLSGGLDSGSVALLASRELAAQGQRLPTYSAIPRYSTIGLTPASRAGDESELIRELVNYAGNIEATILYNDQITPVIAIQKLLDSVDEPFIHAFNANWFQAIFQAASDRGIDVLLCGEGGNLTASFAGDHKETAKSLSRQAKWWSLFHHQVEHILLGGLRVISLTNPSYTWEQLAVRRPGKRHVPMPSPIRVTFAAEVSDEGELQDEPDTDQPIQLRGINTYLRQGLFGRAWNLAAAYGIQVRDPTMDRRLVEFCIGIPPEEYRFGGENRYLLRRGMAGLMPQKVLNNRRRGLQSADVVHQVLASQAEVVETLHRLDKSPLVAYCLDLPAMYGVLDSLRNRPDTSTTFAVMGLLLRGLQIGLFLLRYDA